MDTPLEIMRDEYFQKHMGDCTTCKYYRSSLKSVKTSRGRAFYKIKWCGNEDSEHSGQDLDDVYECDDWSEGNV